MRAAARAVVLVAVMALAGCDARERLGAAEGVQAFMEAAQSGDRAAFEARIDRPRLRESLKARLEAQSTLPPEIARRLDTPEGLPMLDSMVTPEAFNVGFQRGGLLRGGKPTPAEIAAGLRMNGPDQACIPSGPKADDCVMTFERVGDTWKLVAIAPTTLQVAPAP